MNERFRDRPEQSARRRVLRAVAGCAAAVSVLLATGCTTGEQSTDTAGASVGGAFPVTLQSALGPATIPKAPK
ncbi:hypothetical protein ABZ942_00640 [Nocardia sp. NPDC046473]|uniref:hypothetical protein n=1 Tax=Nocardia sp. NPDC046473 TaxID=3155733 RepID=UPI0033C11CA3